MEDKKRRIRVHRGLTFALAIVLTVVIAVVIFQRSGLVSYRLSAYINEHYYRDTPFRFSCGKITGDLVSRLSIADPVIRYEDADRSVKVFSANRITVDYDVVEVFKLKLIVSHLDIDKVRFSIWHDADGNPILPIPENIGGGSEMGVSPHVEIDRFDLRDCEFSFANKDTTITVKDIDLAGSVTYEKNKGDFEITEGSAFIKGRDSDVSSIKVEGDFEDGRLSIKNFVLRLEKSFVMVSGTYDKGRLEHAQAIFNPLSLDEMASFGILNETGEIGGSVVVNGTIDSLAFEGSVTGTALGLVFSGMTVEGLVTPEFVDVSALDGQVYGAHGMGGAYYDRMTGSYGYEGQCERLDITHGFLADRGIPPTDLNGFISFSHDGILKTYDILADLKWSHIAEFEAEDIQFRARWHDDTGLDIRNVTFSRPGYVLNGFGTLDTSDNIDLILTLEGDSLDYLMNYLELPVVGGAVDLAGKVTGQLDDVQVNLNGDVVDLVYLSAEIDSGRINAEAQGLLSGRETATVDIDGERLYLFDREFATPHVRFVFEDSTVTVRDFSFSRGDTFITADFEVVATDSVIPIRVRHVLVQTPNAVWRSVNETTVIYTPTAASIDTVILAANGSRIGFVGKYSPDLEWSDLKFWGRNFDFSVFDGVGGKAAQVAGLGVFDAAVSGDLHNPYVTLSLFARNGVVDSLEFDRVGLDCVFDENGYRLDRFVLHEGLDSVDVTGWWKHAQSPVMVVGAGIERNAALDAPIDIRMNSSGYSLQSVLKLARKRLPMDGGFTGRAALANTLGDPRIEISGVVRSRGEETLVIPEIDTDLMYEDGLLTVNSLSIDDGKNKASVKGTIPLDVDVTKGVSLNRSALIGFTADVDAGDLSVVAGYVGEVAASVGKLEGHLDVQGEASRPLVSGHFRLRDGAFRLTRSDEVYRDINADVRIDDNLIKLTSLAGQKGKKGRFGATGTARLDEFKIVEYAFDATLENFPFSTVPGFESTQDGQLKIVSQLNDAGKLVPSVSGSVEVKEAVITRTLAMNEGPPSPLTMPTESPSWLCHLDIFAPKNVWVRNPEVSMELGGDLVLKRDPKGLYFRGEMRVLRGSYTLYNNKFRITEGTFDFAMANALRPVMNLDAYTAHRRSGDVEEQIFLNLSWPADEKEPKITLSYSEPGYSETDIWAMLGGQVVAGSGGLDADGAFDAGGTATNLASNYLERILNAQMSDMTIAVESGPMGSTGSTSGTEREMSIAIGKYLYEDLYLAYRQGITITSARQIEVEYRLSNMLLLRSEIIQYSTKGIQGSSRQTTDEINVDIKFRYEY